MSKKTIMLCDMCGLEVDWNARPQVEVKLRKYDHEMEDIYITDLCDACYKQLVEEIRRIAPAQKKREED